MRVVLGLFFALIFSGCMSVKMQLDSRWDRKLRASYIDYTDYWILGFVGKGEFNLQKICVDQKPYGFERYRSPEDITIGVFTLGIYTPASLRVWCGN